MEMLENTLREHRRENPSFSSSLLDAICRSIDETNGKFGEQDGMIFYTETTMKKQTTFLQDEEDKMVNFRRTKWMEKKSNEKVAVRKNSMVDFDRKSRNVREKDCKLKNSSSSSSGGFSSSESEYFYGPNPIKTSNSAPLERSIRKSKMEMDSVKTKYSKALKKVKQPISPGGKVATFLNSLFNGGSPKKPKFSNSVDSSEQTASSSSASSFSKSCLSKTPFSGGKLGNKGGTRRCVRFCPVNLDQGMTGDLMKKYDEKISDSEEDDEARSDSSSDLFELENVCSIGIEREECMKQLISTQTSSVCFSK